MASKEVINLIDKCVEEEIIKKYTNLLNLSEDGINKLKEFAKSFKYDLYDLDKIIDFLITKGMKYCDLRDILYNFVSFKTKKYFYELILPHEGIGNIYLLRRGKIKDFDRWANSTDGELFFENSEDLKKYFNKRKEWQNWRLNNLIRTISRRME